MKKIAEYNMVRDDLFENLMMSYQEILNALKFVEEVFPDVFIALSIDPYSLMKDAEDIFKELNNK